MTWSFFLNFFPHGAGPKNTEQSRFAQGHPARSCPTARPPGLGSPTGNDRPAFRVWFAPRIQLSALRARFQQSFLGHPWPTSHRTSCRRSLVPVVPPKIMRESLPVLRFRFARLRSPRGNPVGEMFCHRQTNNKPPKKGTNHEDEQRSGWKSSKSDPRSF